MHADVSSGSRIWWRPASAVVILGALAVLALVPMNVLDQAPSTCPWRNLLGVRCLGCGGTHAMAALLHGDVAAAFEYNALAPAVGVGLALTALHDLIRSLWQRIARE